MNISAKTWSFINEHLHDDVHSLVLQADKYPEIDMKFAVTQISGKQAIASKIPSWYNHDTLIFPQHLSLEQCSSEITAKYKSTLCAGQTFADLTGGFGVDCAFISANFLRSTYVEKQKELSEIAGYNFQKLGLNHISIVNGDSIEYLEKMSAVDCIFIDPARRDKHGKKTVLLSDCEPDVTQIEELLLNKAKQVMIKLSPMLDISLALKDLKHVAEVHILSINNDCKELLLVLNKSVNNPVTYHCLNFAHNTIQEFAFTKEEELNMDCEFTSEVNEFLYEPNASILKAGAYKSIAKKYKLQKLHINSHLYTSSEYMKHFPGRVFKVESYDSLKDKSLVNDITKANITVRNFPLSVAELRKRLKLKEGGDVYLFATTLQNNNKIIIRSTKL